MDSHLWVAFVAASMTDRFPADAEARLGAFAELVAQAIANVDARIKLKESRARLVEAADEARRRIERDLHDGAQQRLVALALSLALVVRSPSRPPRRHSGAASRTCTRRSPSCASWRAGSIRWCSPSGLPAALQALAARSPVPVVLDADLDGRLPAAHEAALYFVAAEALTNVAKYAKASAVEVTLRWGRRESRATSRRPPRASVIPLAPFSAAREGKV